MGEGRDSLGCYACVQSRYPSQLHPLGGVHHLGHFSVCLKVFFGFRAKRIPCQ